MSLRFDEPKKYRKALSTFTPKHGPAEVKVSAIKSTPLETTQTR